MMILSAFVALLASAVVKGSMPGTYLLRSQYSGSGSCSGTAAMSVGNAFGVCMYLPSPPTYLASMFTASATAGSYTVLTYANTDCSANLVLNSTQPADNTCLPAGPESYLYTTLDPTDSWTAPARSGVLVNVFNAASTCAAGGFGSTFYWFSTDFCIPKGTYFGEDTAALSSKFTACSGGSVTYTQYSDTTCTTVLETSTTTVASCAANTLTNGWTQYATSTCTSA